MGICCIPHWSANNIKPIFFLEAGGTGVRCGLNREGRRFYHGPSLAHPTEPCSSLLLGRSVSAGVWKQILCDDAYHALSRQHFQIEVVGIDFRVKGLSEKNPIRITTSQQFSIDEARTLHRN